MCTLSELCPVERGWLDTVSPGPVSATEELCRGAFSPNDIQRSTGEIKPAIIPSSHLYRGEVSVWRVGGTAQYNFAAACNEMSTRAKLDGRVLYRVCVATAEKIRCLAGSEDCRGGLCVIDDTDCGNDERHPAHAHIRLCRSCRPWPTHEEAEKDEKFQEIRADLRQLFLSEQRMPSLSNPQSPD